VDEIQAQRDLLAAERGELHVQMRETNSRVVVAKTITMYLKNEACDGRRSRLRKPARRSRFSPTWLLHACWNLAKNALEATSPAARDVAATR